MTYPRRGEVWLIALNPTRGSEMKKTWPCLVVSPDEMNEPLQTVIVAPMTTTTRTYPTRVNLVFKNKRGQIALDQLRAVDRQRLMRRLGTISDVAANDVSSVLVEMFMR